MQLCYHSKILALASINGQGFRTPYEPLNITSWRRAIVLLLKAKQSRSNTTVNTFTGFPLPTVIRLRHYVRVPYKEIL